MLPLQQAHEVRASVIEYIKATFRFKEKAVGDAFYRFVEDKEDGLFKGPYVSLKTPFVSATEEEAASLPLDIAPDFPPTSTSCKPSRSSPRATATSHAPRCSPRARARARRSAFSTPCSTTAGGKTATGGGRA